VINLNLTVNIFDNVAVVGGVA